MADDYQENRRRFLSDFSDDYGEGPYSDYDLSPPNFDFFPGFGGLTYAGGNFGYQDLDFAGNIFTDPELFAAFAKANPEDAEILRTAFLGGQARDIDDASISEGVINTGDPDNSYKTAETEKFKRQTGGVPIGDPDDPMGTKKLADISGDKTSLPDKLKKLIADVTGLGEDTIGELGKYGLLAGIAKLAYDDAENARKAKLGYIAPGGSAKRAVISPGGSVSYKKAASGGIMSLADGGLVVDDQGRTAQDKQKENLYRQLDAMDAWNTAGATREGAEAPWLMDQANRMMAVGVKDDFTGLGPGVLLYDPAKGQSEIVSSGNLSSWFERGDPAAAYEQAKNSLPYFQQKALLGIEGPTTQAQERRIVKTMVNNPLPALPFIEYGLGQFAPPNYGLDPNIARRRAENKLLNRKEKPFEYFQDFLNLSPYQGGLPTIYQFPELTGYAEGGIASLAGGGETFQMTDYGSNPRNKEVNWAKLQEDRVRMPEAFEGVLQNLNLNNIPSLYSEIPRSQEELENRDYELYAYYGLPDLASNPPNEYLARTIDDIRNALNVGSIPNREQISTIEANQLYDPVGSASVSEMPQFNEEPKIYESNNFTSELSGDLNPAFERELRNWEQTGRWGGGGGGFGKGTGLDFEMSMYSNGGMTTKQPFYLGGPTDGMADQIPAHIDNKRPAALSDGEFVIPADVVSHLGNGNSNAGAKRLYEMMDSIREARTGNSEQGKQINPNKFLPR